MVVRFSGVDIGCLLVFDWLSVALVRLLVCLGFCDWFGVLFGCWLVCLCGLLVVSCGWLVGWLLCCLLVGLLNAVVLLCSPCWFGYVCLVCA